MRTLPLSPLVALVLAGCASSPKPSDGTVQPDRPEEIRITYRGAGAQGRALSARRDTDLARDTEVRAPAARVWQAVPLAYERLRAMGDTSIYLEVPWSEHGFNALLSGTGGQLSLYYSERFLAWAMATRETGSARRMLGNDVHADERQLPPIDPR